MLHELFFPRNVDAIIKILLCSIATTNKCIWHYCKNGDYIVRSSYRLVLEYLADLTHFHVLVEWSELWKLKLPRK